MIACGVRFGFLLVMSEINTVPSMGYSGVASSLPPLRVRRPNRPAGSRCVFGAVSLALVFGFFCVRRPRLSPVHSQIDSPPWTDGPGYGNDSGVPPPPVGRFFRAFEGPRGFSSGSPRLRGHLIVARPRGSGVRVRPKLSSLPLPFAVSRRPARCSLQHLPVAPRRAGRCDGEAWVRRPDAGGGHLGGGRPSRRRTHEPRASRRGDRGGSCVRRPLPRDRALWAREAIGQEVGVCNVYYGNRPKGVPWGNWEFLGTQRETPETWWLLS